MPITNDSELAKATEEVGRLLQEIQDYKGRELHKNCRIRFPRGWIRTAKQHRARIGFIADSALKDNIAYTLILADVIHWNLVRTDLSGTAMEMLIKSHMFLLGTVVESLTKAVLKGKCGQNFCKRIDYLRGVDIINEELKGELNWLWSMRNRMHLFMIDGPEYSLPDYTTKNHNRSVLAFRALLAALERASNKQR